MINYLIKRTSTFRKFCRNLYLPGGIKLWTTCTCFCFIGYSILNNFDKLSQQSISKFSILCLFTGFLVSWLSLIINAIAWQRIINWLGYRSRNVDFISLFLSTNILKYLPGGVWHFLERFRTLKNYMSSEKSFYSVLLEPFFMIAAALFWVPFGESNIITFILCYIPLLFFSKLIRRPITFILRKLKIKDFSKIDPGISIRKLNSGSKLFSTNYPYDALIIEILFIGLRFGGFWFCLYAFSIQNALSITSWISAFSMSWIVGLVIPSAPGGVGVFEAFILLVLKDGVSETSLISVLLCYRVIVSLADLFAAITSNSKNKYMKVNQ